MEKITFRELPFSPSNKWVIYIENDYDENLNHFLSDNYSQVCNIFEQNGLEFIYLPIRFQESNILEKILYYAPYLKIDKSVSGIIKSNVLLNLLTEDIDRRTISPSLLYNANKSDDNWSFKHLLFDDCSISLQLFKLAAEDIKDSLPVESPRKRLCYQFSIGKRSHLAADANNDLFNQDESEKVIKELEEAVRKLRLNGVSLLAIHELIDKQEPISKIVISAENRIFLPDYNNIEIEMGALPKALYFLFLRYPEGLVFKQLIDHEKELLNIYHELRPSTDEAVLQASIQKLVDPFGNAVNENVARIRKAFVEKFDERLAKNYIISGEKGGTYKIPLSRDMVIWEE